MAINANLNAFMPTMRWSSDDTKVHQRLQHKPPGVCCWNTDNDANKDFSTTGQRSSICLFTLNFSMGLVLHGACPCGNLRTRKLHPQTKELTPYLD